MVVLSAHVPRTLTPPKGRNHNGTRVLRVFGAWASAMLPFATKAKERGQRGLSKIFRSKSADANANVCMRTSCVIPPSARTLVQRKLPRRRGLACSRLTPSHPCSPSQADALSNDSGDRDANLNLLRVKVYCLPSYCERGWTFGLIAAGGQCAIVSPMVVKFHPLQSEVAEHTSGKRRRKWVCRQDNCILSAMLSFSLAPE